MKAGDQFEVSIDGHVVTAAVVEYVEDNKATILIPQTRVVMAIRSNLAGPAQADTSLVERDFTALPETGTESTSPAQDEVEQGTTFATAPVEGQSMRGMNLDSSGID